MKLLFWYQNRYETLSAIFKELYGIYFISENHILWAWILYCGFLCPNPFFLIVGFNKKARIPPVTDTAIPIQKAA